VDVVGVDHLDFEYRRYPWSRGRAALRDVTMQVRAGELHLLAGANGAGKSTLLALLAGVLEPTRGRASVFERRPVERSLRPRVAWLPEAVDSTSRLTAHHSVELSARLHGAFGRAARERADASLEAVGMSSLARRPLRTLSKGERRRVGVAATLATGASLLLLDEPLDGVDPESSELLLAKFAELCRAGASVLLSTHVLLDGRRGGDTLTVLDAGRVVASGPPASVLAAPDGSPRSFAELLRAARGEHS
jgi:ABC-type multidrug transport system ATPase subunit